MTAAPGPEGPVIRPPLFTRDTSPEAIVRLTGAATGEGRVRYFRKTTLTPAVRIEGPFAVETSEGTMRCEDGWLAWDSSGNPYPIAAAIFAATYEPAPDHLRLGTEDTPA